MDAKPRRAAVLQAPSPQAGCLKLCFSHFTFYLNTVTEDLQKCFSESSILLETLELLGLDFPLPLGKIVLFSIWSTRSGISHLTIASQIAAECSVNLQKSPSAF